MAIVNISVDTNSRQAVLTVDGQIVPVVACHLNKGVDFDGNPFLHLSYVVEVQNDNNGLIERREFFLPDEEDASVFAEENGLSSRVVKADKHTKAALDVIKYMADRKK